MKVISLVNNREKNEVYLALLNDQATLNEKLHNDMIYSSWAKGPISYPGNEGSDPHAYLSSVITDFYACL